MMEKKIRKKQLQQQQQQQQPQPHHNHNNNNNNNHNHNHNHNHNNNHNHNHNHNNNNNGSPLTFQNAIEMLHDLQACFFYWIERIVPVFSFVAFSEMVAQYFGKATCDGFSLHAGRPELFAYLKRQKISEAVLSKLLYVFKKKKKP